jgi:lysophospholipase L1-like esterase
MSELCVLAAVSIAAAQSYSITQRFDQALADPSRVEHTEIAIKQTRVGCSPSQASGTGDRPVILASVEAVPEFSSSEAGVVNERTTDNREEQGDRPSRLSNVSNEGSERLSTDAHPPDSSPPSQSRATLAQITVPETKWLRPSSGRQFYRQRYVALQSGQAYTRITPDTFAESWLSSTYEPTHEDWVSLLAREAQAMGAGQGENRLTIMVGDSISLWFPTEYMSRHRFWLNQSISGDTAAGTLQRLNLFAQTNPDMIHVMIGINDLRGGASNQQILAHQHQIIRQLRQQHPNAQVIVHSLLPTRLASLSNDRILRINRHLGVIAAQEGARMLDLHQYFVDSSGQMNPALTTDGLHLNAAGYELWYRVLSQTY